MVARDKDRKMKRIKWNFGSWLHVLAKKYGTVSYKYKMEIKCFWLMTVCGYHGSKESRKLTCFQTYRENSGKHLWRMRSLEASKSKCLNCLASYFQIFVWSLPIQFPISLLWKNTVLTTADDLGSRVHQQHMGLHLLFGRKRCSGRKRDRECLREGERRKGIWLLLWGQMAGR